MSLVLNPLVEALPGPSPPGATTHHAALPAPPGASPTARIDPSVLQPPGASAARLKEAAKKLPLYFIENRGQADPRVAYYVQGAGTSVYFSRAGITFALTSPAKSVAGAARTHPGGAGLGGPGPDTVRRAGRLEYVAGRPDCTPHEREIDA